MKAQFGVSETVLIVGVLTLAGLLAFQLKGLYEAQAGLAERAVVVQFAKDLEAVVERAIATTGDINFTYFPLIKRYKLKVENSVVSVLDKISGQAASFAKSVEIADIGFEDCEALSVIKRGKKIYVICECLKEGHSCEASELCCSGYCWGEPLTCQADCAPVGAKAADARACCSGYLNESMQCDGSKVKPSFALLFVQVGGKVNDFEERAKRTTEKWIELSPLSECPTKVGMEVVGEVCKVDPCSYPAIYSQVKSCASGYEYTRIVALYPGSDVCGVYGFTGLYAEVVVVAGYSPIYEYVVAHELGHTFGLCDEGYGVVKCPDCKAGICGYGFPICEISFDCKKCLSTVKKGDCGKNAFVCANGSCVLVRTASYECPNKPSRDSLMCSIDKCGTGCSKGSNFSESSYVHLTNELSQYCKS